MLVASLFFPIGAPLLPVLHLNLSAPNLHCCNLGQLLLIQTITLIGPKRAFLSVIQNSIYILSIDFGSLLRFLFYEAVSERVVFEMGESCGSSLLA